MILKNFIIVGARVAQALARLTTTRMVGRFVRHTGLIYEWETIAPAEKGTDIPNPPFL